MELASAKLSSSSQDVMPKVDDVIAVVQQAQDQSTPGKGQTDAPLAKNAFNNLSAFGFSFAVLNTWVVLVVGLGSGLASGGPSAC
jgi:hypothetical protein